MQKTEIFTPPLKWLIEKNRITLRGHRDSLNIRLNDWFASLLLALGNGWQPIGTELNRDHLRVKLSARQPGCLNKQGKATPIRSQAEVEAIIARAPARHNGSYFSHYDIITIQDAMNLAAALEHALENDSIGEPLTRETLPFENEILGWNQNPADLLNTQAGREQLKAIIALCKNGRFYVA